MAFLSFKKARIKGVTTSVPAFVEPVSGYKYFTPAEAEKFSASTGVYSRHTVNKTNVTSSDLCFHAANHLLEGIGWSRESIGALIFVSQTRDYILPSTSCILQQRLGLPDECYTMDIPYGCSGYLYGLQASFSLIECKGDIKRVLLLVGDVVTPHHNEQDTSSYPLFGDAGTATAIEYEDEDSDSFYHFGTDGSGYEAIMIPDGGYRNRVNQESFDLKDFGPEGKRTNLDCALKGMDVFSFGMSRAPQSVKKLLEKHNLNPDDIDYFLMHQANKFLNEKIRKKLKISESKVPYALEQFGNTSCASIPVTMCANLSSALSAGKHRLLLSAFGVGLSWGSAWIETDRIYCKNPFEYDL